MNKGKCCEFPPKRQEIVSLGVHTHEHLVKRYLVMKASFTCSRPDDITCCLNFYFSKSYTFVFSDLVHQSEGMPHTLISTLNGEVEVENCRLETLPPQYSVLIVAAKLVIVE